MSAKKPTKSGLRRIAEFLARVHREANAIGDSLDPNRKQDYAYGDPTCLLTIIDGLCNKAGYGLNLPVLAEYTSAASAKKEA
jgi:hypothetical protein